MTSNLSLESKPTKTTLSDEDYWTITLDLETIWRGVVLFIATLLSHWQAIGGGFIWDDDAHVTRVDLRSLEGLWAIWFKLGATQQYYPLLHSIFWFEHAFWGDNATLYHIANIFLHTTVVLLLVAVLKKASIPGAWFAGFIFALHPVLVESVAWITEQKNTISAVFYLLAVLYYLNFDKERRKEDYFKACMFFVCALLSKTVTATLPAALLVLLWWKNGSLSFRKDIMPLLPWFVIGAIGGLFTAYVERVYIGANGSDFMLTPVMRCLLAGRVIWFYLGKLIWPANLLFIYEHWLIDSSSALQYVYPLGVIITCVCLYRLSRRGYSGEGSTTKSRAPLAGYLFFCGTLFPVLGFVNVYPFMFSYVADHFQYLASLGIIIPISAGLTVWLDKLPKQNHGIVSAGCGVCIALLSFLSWNQCAMYVDGETLYKTELSKNPLCWMAHNNYGAILLNKGQISEAQIQFEEAIKIRPPYADAQSNLCSVLIRTGHPEEALSHGLEALRLRESPENENNVAIALMNLKRVSEAVPHYEKALSISPKYVEVLNNLGNAYMQLGRNEDALKCYQSAIRYNPNFADAYSNIGVLLGNVGRFVDSIPFHEQAVRLMPNTSNFHLYLANTYSNVNRQNDALLQYQESIKLNPNNIDAWYALGNILVSVGRYADAEQPYLNTLKLNSNVIGAENNLAAVYFKLGRIPEAIGHYGAAIKINPQYAEAHSNLGVALAASKLFEDAIKEYLVALKINPKYADAINNLGLAYAAVGKNNEALNEYKKAITINAKNPEYYENLGRTYSILGNNTEAKAALAVGASLREAPSAQPTSPAKTK